MPEVPQLKTRKPTGKPPWPMVLLAGAEKSGKSFVAAEFSASDLVDRTFWCEIGEGAADQYGAIPGARYEILEHDGSYQSIGRELWKATRQPRGESGKPHAIVVDPVTTLWDMLSDEAQGIANERARRAADKQNRPAPTGDRVVTVDLWNGAKKRWGKLIDVLRAHQGPVILIARLELVTVMDGDKPTTEKAWKVRAEKNLPYEVDAIVRMPSLGKAELTGVRSVLLRMPDSGVLPMPKFSVDRLLRDLGLDQEGATAPRAYTAPAPDAANAEADMDGRVMTPAAAAASEQLCEDITIAITDATTMSELKALYVSAKRAHSQGRLTDEQFAKLDQLGSAQVEDLNASAGAGV